jgi:hypothetical protein
MALQAPLHGDDETAYAMGHLSIMSTDNGSSIFTQAISSIFQAMFPMFQTPHYLIYVVGCTMRPGPA